MKVVIYLRAAAGDPTVDTQRNACRAAAELNGCEVVAEIDDGAGREGLDRIMEMVRAREVGAIFAYKLDRLARSLPEFVQVLWMFEIHAVALVCPGQHIDTSSANPAGRLQAHVIACVGEAARSFSRGRATAALNAARAAGLVGGRKPIEKPEGWKAKVIELRTVRAIATHFEISTGTASAWRKEALVSE